MKASWSSSIAVGVSTGATRTCQPVAEAVGRAYVDPNPNPPLMVPLLVSVNVVAAVWTLAGTHSLQAVRVAQIALGLLTVLVVFTHFDALAGWSPLGTYLSFNRAPTTLMPTRNDVPRS